MVVDSFFPAYLKEIVDVPAFLTLTVNPYEPLFSTSITSGLEFFRPVGFFLSNQFFIFLSFSQLKKNCRLSFPSLSDMHGFYTDKWYSFLIPYL